MMKTLSSPAQRKRARHRRRQVATVPPPTRTATAAAGERAAAVTLSPTRRAPTPSRPLLPLIVHKSDVAARGICSGGPHRTPRQHTITPGSGGFLSRIERGELPPNCDLEAALTSDGPMRSVRAPLHAAVADRRQRQPVMTEVSGFKQMNDFKLDYGEIEKLPAKLNMTELHRWELDEAAERADAAARAAAAAASRASSSSSTSSPTSSSVTTPVDPSNAASALARDDPRTYTELLDLYSMHEFIIRKGKTLRSTPEFASFKRHYASAWGGIESLISALEELLGMYGVDLAYVDGKKLAALASHQFGPDAAAEDLLECIANAEEVEPLLGNVAHQYRYGHQGHHLAAAKIQAVWRMYRQSIAYKHLLLGTRAATVIQRQWAIYRAHCVTRRTIQAVRQTRVARWKQTMVQFCAQWPRIRQGRRTVIHIPSLSYPVFHAKKVPFYMAQQLGQLTRLCDLIDPKVDVVLVAPFKPEPEVMAYYYSILEEASVANAKGRFTMLVPEEASRLPDGMSLTRLVLLSSRLMKMLRALSTGKPAFIVPGTVGPEELALASELDIPLLGPEPHVAQVFGSKSGCHRLLEAADVATPVGARQLRSRGDLLRALTSLMLTHRECPRWLVKLETESGSRGHAYFDVGRMKTLKNLALAQQAVAGPGAVFNAEDALTATPVFDMLLKELEDYGAKRVRLVHPSAYPDWTTYLDMLDTVGACVEAVPSKPAGCVTANLFVEPSGEVQLHSVVEPLLAPAFTVMGSCCPPTTNYPRSLVEDAALRVGRAAFRKRVFGYMSVDLVLVHEQPTAATTATTELAAGEARHGKAQRSSEVDDAEGAVASLNGRSGTNGRGCSINSAPSDAGLSVWGVDIDLAWTNNAVAHHFASMLSGLKAGSTDGGGGAVACGSQRQSASCASANFERGPSPEDSPPTTSLPRPAVVPELPYVYSGLIYNPFISSIRHTSFFSLCRSRGISYDRDRQSGVVFHLVDVLLRGCLGVLSVGPEMQRNVRKLAAFQSLLNMELPKQGEHSAESNFAYFSAVIRQLARVVDSNTDSH